MNLASDALELAVAEAFRRLGASVQQGPKGEHDLEISFPNILVRELGNGLFTRLRVNKKFVVEVKSSQKEGAKLGDLRQVHDWVLRETRRMVPPEAQDLYLYELETAREDAIFRLAGSQFRRTSGEDEDAREAIEELMKTVDLVLTSLIFRVKGLLVINHHAATEGARSRPFLESNALRYAKDNKIAVMSWQNLLAICDQVQGEAVDPLNFWCSVFETSGSFEMGIYDWKERASFQGHLFDPYEVTVETRAQFLKPGPEATLDLC